MIGKNILTFISLLFVGSQISRVAANAEALEACVTTEGGNLNGKELGNPTPTNYCLNDNGNETFSIKGYDDDNWKVMDEGVYIFDGNYALVEPKDVSAAELSIYICDADKNCKRTYGYIKKDDNTYYKIEHDGSAAEVADIANSKAASACTPGELFKDSGATPKDRIEYCVATGIGIPVNDGINYLATNDGSPTGTTIFTASPFSGTGKKQKIVVKSFSDGFVMNNMFKGSSGVYCDYETNKVLDRMENYCTGTILNFMFSCTDGLCEQSDSIFQNNDLKIVKIGGKNKVYKCKVESGYTSFVEEKANGVFAYKTVATDTTYFDKAIDGDYTIADDFATNVAKSGLRIFDCHDGECDVTNGYAKFNDGAKLGKFTADVSGVTGTWAERGASAETCDSQEQTSHVQLDATNLKLCISGASATEVEDTKTYYVKDNLNAYHAYTVNGKIIGATKPNNGYYLLTSHVLKTAAAGTADDLVSCTDGACTHLDAAQGNYISGIDKGLIQCSDAGESNCNLHANTQGYYLNAVVSKVLLVCDGTSCEELATADIGYYKNNEDPVNYIKCTATDNCVANTPGTCSDSNSNGKLTSDGQLCLKDSKFVPMTNSGQYLITAGSNSIFSTVTDFGVVVSGSNKVILDTSVGTPVCVNSDQQIITAVDKSACTAASGTYYESCGEGLCTLGEVACDLTSSTSNGCSAKTYYLAEASGSTTALKNSQLSGKTGYVFYCETAGGTCVNKSTAGFYVNSKDQAFSCGEGAGSCKLVTDIPTDTCAKNGALVIKDTNDVHICLNTVGNISVKLDADNRYYVAKYEAENVFGIANEGFGLVTVTAKTAHLKTEYSTAVKYVYAKKSDLQVMIRGETCPDKVAGSYPLLEVNCDEYGKCTSVPDDE